MKFDSKIEVNKYPIYKKYVLRMMLTVKIVNIVVLKCVPISGKQDMVRQSDKIKNLNNRDKTK